MFVFLLIYLMQFRVMMLLFSQVFPFSVLHNIVLPHSLQLVPFVFLCFFVTYRRSICGSRGLLVFTVLTGPMLLLFTPPPPPHAHKHARGGPNATSFFCRSCICCHHGDLVYYLTPSRSRTYPLTHTHTHTV